MFFHAIDMSLLLVWMFERHWVRDRNPSQQRRIPLVVLYGQYDRLLAQCIAVPVAVPGPSVEQERRTFYQVRQRSGEREDAAWGADRVTQVALLCHCHVNSELILLHNSL